MTIRNSAITLSAAALLTLSACETQGATGQTWAEPAAPDETSTPTETSRPPTTRPTAASNSIDLVITDVQIGPSGPQRCVLRATVDNNGSAESHDVRVWMEMENLRGPGAPDHVLIEGELDGPTQLGLHQTATYVTTISWVMAPGDVWSYSVSAGTKGSTVDTVSRSNLPSPCEWG